MEAVVNGKKVCFYTEAVNAITARQFRAITKAEATLDYEPIAAALQPFIESWEFGGDPKNAESWGDLNMFDDLMGINRALAEQITTKAKNSATKSTAQ